MEQVILDHLYSEVKKSGNHSDSKNRKRIVLELREHNNLISLFGKYPNFVMFKKGIKTNHSGYKVNYYGIYGVYDEELEKNHLIYVNNLPIGIAVSYLDKQNEPFRINLYGEGGIMKKEILYSET